MEHRKSLAAAARVALGTFVAAMVLVATGCGSGSHSPPGLTISGPGLQVSKPPWAPEYKHLAQRLKELGLPPGGKETFHIHALLSIYVNGLLVPLAANIGLDPAHHVESSMHTHDRTGIVHMEAPHPFNYTLGDFFAVWGVKLGPAQLGGLTGYGGDKLHFFLDGKPLSNPAAHVLRNRDRIVIGYGPPKEYPHEQSLFLLQEVEKGEGGLGCGVQKGKRGHSCLAPQTKSTQGTSKS